MSLPVPKLDDREFSDLVEEAKARIQRRCPQWTDFNPSDPGMTIVELMAWLTEVVLYRLNRVPDRNFIKFLELIGVTLKPAASARAWVQFVPTPAYPEKILVPARTRLSTKKQKDDEPIQFETCYAFEPTGAKLVTVFSHYLDAITHHTPVLTGDFEPPPERRVKEAQDAPPPSPALFTGASGLLHLWEMWDGTTNLGGADLVGKLQLRMRVRIVTPAAKSLRIEWQLWDGKDWVSLVPASDGTDGLQHSGDLVFDTLRPAAATPFGLRARLVAGEVSILPRLASVQHRLEVNPNLFILPDAIFYRSARPVPETGAAGTRFEEIDPNGAFRPFGGKPFTGDLLYLRSRAFQRPGTTISIDFKLAQTMSPADYEVLRNVGLRLEWEYFTTSGEWKSMGHGGADTGPADASFRDGTLALTQSGEVTFTVPDDVGETTEIHNQRGCFIRVKIAAGDYGADDSRVPLVLSVRIRFVDPMRNWERIERESYFSRENITAQFEASNAPRQGVEPFQRHTEKDPALYLGFDTPLPNSRQRIYFSLAQPGEIGVPEAQQPLTSTTWLAPPTLSWEYGGPDIWTRIENVTDGTDAFAHSGVVELTPPPASAWPQSSSSLTNVPFTRPAHWLRCRVESGEIRQPPQLHAIYLSVVAALQAHSIENEVLGSGTGKAGQTFRLSQTPILSDPFILIREQPTYSVDALADLRKEVGADAVVEVPSEAAADAERRAVEVWVRWREVESFAASKPEDRHFVVNHQLGLLTFGDGERGKLVPAGTKNVKAELYQLTAGARGNVGAKTITVLEDPLRGVDRVSNVEAAGGGADTETIEEAKQRGPATLEHRYRAVTAGDFEHLAVEASTQVAKARCIVNDDGAGQDGGTSEITVVILPKSLGDRPAPDAQLVRQVSGYLNERRLLTTRLRVVGPEYVGIRIRVEVVPHPQWVSRFPAMAIEIEEQLRGFIHPRTGGSEGTGWPMGRTLHQSELYYVIERLPGVDYIERLTLQRWQQGGYASVEENIRMNTPRSLPYFREIEIVQG